VISGVKDNVDGQSQLDLFRGDLDLTPLQWSRLEMLWSNSAMLPLTPGKNIASIFSNSNLVSVPLTNLGWGRYFVTSIVIYKGLRSHIIVLGEKDVGSFVVDLKKDVESSSLRSSRNDRAHSLSSTSRSSDREPYPLRSRAST
jgi:hypothetical protein